MTVAQMLKEKIIPQGVTIVKLVTTQAGDPQLYSLAVQCSSSSVSNQDTLHHLLSFVAVVYSHSVIQASK